jgi:hypothetical protein
MAAHGRCAAIAPNRRPGDKEERFTSLAHFIDEAALRRAYRNLRADAAVGIDGETKASHGKGLQPRLAALPRCRAVERGSLPHATGEAGDDAQGRWQRTAAGVWSVEDKRVQGAAIEC